MSKHFKDDRYFWWSILSTVLLVRDRTHPDAALLLSVTERQLSTRYAHLAQPEETTGDLAKKPRGYNSADEFHVVTRFLELRAQYASSSASSSSSSATLASSSAPPLVLPSLLPAPTPDAPAPSPADALLAHFASPEADKWCATNLGLELWRREVGLEYGTRENGAWEREVKRLRGALEKG